MSTPYNPFASPSPNGPQGGYPQYQDAPRYSAPPQAQMNSGYAPYYAQPTHEGRSPIWPKVGVIALFLLLLAGAFLPMMYAKATVEDFTNEFDVSIEDLPEGIDEDAFLEVNVTWWGNVNVIVEGIDHEEAHDAIEEEKQELLDDEEFVSALNLIRGMTVAILVLAGFAVVCVLFNNRLAALPGIIGAMIQLGAAGLAFMSVSAANGSDEIGATGTGTWIYFIASIVGFVFYFAVLAAGGKKYPPLQPAAYPAGQGAYYPVY